MTDIADRSLDNEVTEAEELIVRDPAASISQREHRALSVQGSVHLAITSHGFTKGKLIGRSGSAWVLADADNSIPALYWVVYVIDANNVLVAKQYKLTLTSHGKTPLDQDYYLSTTAGDFQSSEPEPGDISQVVGYVLDANTVLCDIQEAKQ